MKTKKVIAELVSLVLFGCGVWAAPASADYTVVILDAGWGSYGFAASDGQQVGVVDRHAALWSGTAASFVDLHPTGFVASQARGVCAGQQVGIVDGHAALWSGTAASFVDLNPEGFDMSQAFATSGSQQVGFAGTVYSPHAFLWSGTAESCVDLHPPSGPTVSWAFGISGGQQVGYGQGYGTGKVHALLWSGTADSVIDLHSDSFEWTLAFGVSNGQQVGYGEEIGTLRRHALLWSGTAESCVDLQPSELFVESEARGVCNGQQVGWGNGGISTGGQYHALLWSGTPESCIDLHVFLPFIYDISYAYGIDSAGNIVGFAHVKGTVGVYNAILWVPSVASTPPTIESISAPLNPVQVNTAVTASGFFSDPDASDTHTALWDWGDGTATQGTVNEGEQSVSGGHTYTAPGTYALTLTVTDASGGSDQRVFEYVVVYDPMGGFVTGAGWIDSPEGAYRPNLSLVGRARFGFVSKYEKGATRPTGQTEFVFRTADVSFHSSSYDWLVVTGSDYAKFKGIGTINGLSESYKFMLWAGDGDPDTFRIKIWYEEEGVELFTVYDNGMDQEISGGNIIVHTK